MACCFFCNFLQKMARQTIVIESPKELSLREGMIVIADRETAEEILRPLEDILMIMIDHHSARITVPLINKLASYNVCVVFCDEKHMPVTMTMDLYMKFMAFAMMAVFSLAFVSCRDDDDDELGIF